jgi:hypothetical protein
VAEFRISSKAVTSHDTTTRLVLWGAVPALVVIAVLGVLAALHGNDSLNEVAVVLAVATVIFVVGAAHYFGVRMGMDRVRRDSHFLLTDRELVRKRHGWPDVQIRLSEMRALCERPAFLIVEGATPSSRIAVPKEVEGFELLRAELLKHAPLVKPPTRSFLYWIPTVISFACWPLVLWSHDTHVVLGAGIVLLALSGWLCLSFDKKLAHVPKRALIRVWLAVSWAIALWFVYTRIARL